MRTRDARPLLGAAVLLAATAALYAGHLDGPFFFDDHASVVRNERIHQLWPPTWAWHEGENPLAARPAAAATLALDFALHGRAPTGYRITNLLLHGANALLLLGVARRLLRRWPALRPTDGEALGLAWATALVWSIHPLQTEAVVYVTQRTELLVGFFYLATLLAALRGFDAGSARARRTWFAGAALACAMGALSKEVIVTAPLLVLFADRAFVCSGFGEALRRHRGLYAGLGISWVIVAALVVTGPRAAAVVLGQGVSPLESLRTQAGVVAQYLKLCFWPDALRLSYPFTTATRWSDVRPEAFAVVLVFVATLWALWRHPRAGFAGAWFFGILAPSSSFVPVVTEIAAERRMYLPLAAVVGAVAVATFLLARRLGTRLGGPRFARATALAVGAAVVLALGARSSDRLDDYRSRAALWRADARIDPDNPAAAWNLALALLDERRHPEAATWLERAAAALLRLDRDAQAAVLRASSVDLLVTAYGSVGRPDLGLALLRELAAGHPEAARVQLAYGRAAMLAGVPAEAEAPLRRAVALVPDSVEAWTALSEALARSRQREPARAALEEAIARAHGSERERLLARRRQLDAPARGSGP